MKRLIAIAAVSFVFLPARFVLGQGGPARFQQIVEISVKPGQELVFENYVKKIVAAANKLSAKQTWSTFQVPLGKPGATYRVALGFSKWADRDGWATIPELLTKAYGQQEAERLLKEGGGAVERSVNEIWEYLPDGSSNIGRAPSGPPAFSRVTVLRVQPAMAGAYEVLAAKFKAAYEASAEKPVVTRWVLRMGPFSGSTFRRTESFSKWAELDAPAGAQIVQKHYGAQEGAKLGDELRRMTINQQEFVSVRRPDLSRPAPAPSSQ